MLDVLQDDLSPIASAAALAARRLHFDLMPVRSISWPDALLYRECLVPGTEQYPAEIALGLVLTRLNRHPSEVLACKISAQSLQCPATWDRLRRSIQANPSLARRVILEITGAPRLRDIAGFKLRLADVRSIGCRVAIDEFGAGALPPELLHALAVDMIKVDADHLKAVRRTRARPASLDHIVGFAACLAPIVVVKGVDRGPLLELLAASGATHVQPSLLRRTAQGVGASIPCVERPLR